MCERQLIEFDCSFSFFDFFLNKIDRRIGKRIELFL